MNVKGWKKDHRDERDFLHKAKVVKLPTVVMLDDFIPDVRDQGNLGSCVGFGVAGSLCATAKQLNSYVDWFSPMWIYNGARWLEDALAWDDGAYPRDAMKFIYSYGCLLEQYHPYADKLDTTPPLVWPNAGKAKEWPLVQYVRVVDGMEGLKDALASGHVVAIGNPWFGAWMNTDNTGMLKEDYTQPIGGHMTFLYGYDADKAVFFGQNSWGSDWGLNGRFKMPFSAIEEFKVLGGYDAYYVVAKWSVAPSDHHSKLTWVLAISGLLGTIALGLKLCGKL